MFREFKIILNEEVDKYIFLLRLENSIKVKALPGQFAMIRISDCYDPLLPRPLSIYKISNNYIEFLYKVVGKGTYLLSKKNQGAKIKILLPLGKNFPIPKKGEKVALIGGGMGIVPLSFLLESIFDKVEIYSYIGFPVKISKKIWENFEKKSRSFLISTEDGSLGEKGMILDFIKDLDKFDRIYSCGPISMLRSLWAMIDKKEKLYISLEERMACGYGVCLGCVFMEKNKNLHICKDGPVFSGLEVDFSEF